MFTGCRKAVHEDRRRDKTGQDGGNENKTVRTVAKGSKGQDRADDTDDGQRAEHRRPPMVCGPGCRRKGGQTGHGNQHENEEGDQQRDQYQIVAAAALALFPQQAKDVIGDQEREGDAREESNSGQMTSAIGLCSRRLTSCRN